MHITYSDRLKMDRRRFELAHLKYAVLKIAERYADDLNLTDIPITPDLKATLEKITPVFYSSFRARYAGGYYY